MRKLLLNNFFNVVPFLKKSTYKIQSNVRRCLESRCDRCYRISLPLFFLFFVSLPFVCLVDVRYWHIWLRARLSSSTATATSGVFETSIRREDIHLGGGSSFLTNTTTKSSRARGDIANEAERQKVTPCRQVLALRTGH